MLKHKQQEKKKEKKKIWLSEIGIHLKVLIAGEKL